MFEIWLGSISFTLLMIVFAGHFAGGIGWGISGNCAADKEIGRLRPMRRSFVCILSLTAQRGCAIMR